MRTLLFFIVAFILLFTIQNCNDNSQNNDKITVNSIQPNKSLNSNALKCCNLGRPVSCEENEERSLLTDIGDITISCECCQQVWDFYGGELPPGEEIPHIIIGTSVCIPSKEDSK